MDDTYPTVQVDFTLSIGEGRLTASLPVPADHVTLTQMLPALRSLSSQIVGSTVEVIQTEGYEVSCRAGCGACCRQLVPLSLFEAEAMAAWMESLPETQQLALEGRFRAVLLSLRDAGILDRLNPAVFHSGSEEAKRLAIDYLAQRTPCPFLENESCSIYPIRPLVCREYLVTSPPEFCNDPSIYPVAGVPIPVKLSKVLVQLSGMVEKSSGGWIPLVFLLAWARSGARPGDAIAGPGPELLQGVLRRLTV